VVKLETVKFFFPLSYLLPVCGHVGVTTVQLSHNLIDDKFRVSTNIKLLNPKPGGDLQTVDQCLIFCHSVGDAEV
jgi:hypothetical protein